MHQIRWPFVCNVSSRYFSFLEKTSEFALLLLLLFPFKFAVGVISLQYGFMLLMWNMVASEVLC
jgi:nitrate reductase NapE component